MIVLKKRFILWGIGLIAPLVVGAVFVLAIALIAAASSVNSQAQTTSIPSTSSSSGSINVAGNVNGMPISNNLLTFLKQWEGYYSAPYQGEDSWNETIGYGHVIQPGESYTYLSQTDAVNLLIQDLKTGGYITSVQKTFAGVQLNQHQFDALVSLAFNIGPGAWSDLSLTQDIKTSASGNVITADFEKICYVGNQWSNGLYRRRQAEAAMYTQGVYQGP